MEQRSKDVRNKDTFTTDLMVEDVVQSLESYNLNDEHADSQLSTLQVLKINN